MSQGCGRDVAGPCANAGHRCTIPASVSALATMAADPSGPAGRAHRYPQLRFMGSKHRLLPWLSEVLADLRFDVALDAFSGSGCVAYLLKAMGKRVVANDFLRFPATIAKATVENDDVLLDHAALSALVAPAGGRDRFI